MLIERATKLREGVERLVSLGRLAEDTRLLGTRASMLGTPTDELAQLATSLAVLRRCRVPVIFDAWRVGNLRTLAKELQSEYVPRPEMILAADQDGRFPFWNALKELPGHLRAALRTAWVAHVDKTIPRDQPELLDILAHIQAFAPQVSTIRKLYLDAARLRGILPEDDTHVFHVRELAAKIAAAWHSLEGDGIPDVVLAFLKAAATDGATVDQLTPEVVSWLTERDLQQDVRIRLGGSA